MLGISGAPGAGKSTLAAALVAAHRRDAVVVPMDGFHLHDEELAAARARRPQGGARDLRRRGVRRAVRRLRDRDRHVVYAPEFVRARELSVAGAIAVRPEHRLVVTEGNYLLLDEPGWRAVRPLLDEVWFVEGDEATRLSRLVRRHVEHGKPPDLAQRWVTESDQANAEIVARTRKAADVLVKIG